MARSPITTRVDASAMVRGLKLWADAMGTSFTESARIHSARLLKDAVKWTWPKNRTQGRQAVRRDVKRAIWFMDPGKLQSPSLRRFANSHPAEFVQTILNKTHPGAEHVGERGEFKPAHESMRDRRGRVRKNKTKYVTTKERMLERYIGRRRKMVGYAKSGWVNSFNVLRNRIKPTSRLSSGRSAKPKPLVGWVQPRKFPYIAGSLHDTMGFSGFDGKVVMTNFSPWAQNTKDFIPQMN